MTWRPFDLSPYFGSGHTPPKPTIGTVRGTSLGLFYQERINVLFGPSGAGKTWVMLGIVAEYLMLGQPCVFVDHEDHPTGAICRLLALGVSESQILENFIYVQPAERWSRKAEAELKDALSGRSPVMAVIDSTGEGLALDGCNPNLDDDVARWIRGSARFFTTTGAAVVLLDHIAKSENANKGMPVGSFRKMAVVSGAAYKLEVKKSPHRGSEGLLELVVKKDRSGWRAVGAVACVIRLTPGTGDRLTVAFYDHAAKHPDEPSRPIFEMERICQWLADMDRPVTLTEIRSAPIGRNNVSVGKDKVEAALNVLRDEGFIEWPRRGRITLVRPYLMSQDEKLGPF
jgi:hypothetical protein